MQARRLHSGHRAGRGRVARHGFTRVARQLADQPAGARTRAASGAGDWATRLTPSRRASRASARTPSASSSPRSPIRFTGGLREGSTRARGRPTWTYSSAYPTTMRTRRWPSSSPSGGDGWRGSSSASSRLSDEQLERLARTGTPVVLVNRQSEGAGPRCALSTPCALRKWTTTEARCRRCAICWAWGIRRSRTSEPQTGPSPTASG